MYFDRKRNRTLLRNGKSVLTPFEFSRRLIEGKDVSSLMVEMCDDSDAYELVYGETVGCVIEAIDVSPSSHISTDDDVFFILDMMVDSPRYECSMDDRIALEMDYFIRTNNIMFLMHCIELVQRMKDAGVVWGVGRGSACASVVMYLIEINDINPLQYDIPFEELSKEQYFDE